MNLFDGLFVVFLVLKLCGVIDWSWWWVTAPIWGSFLWIIVWTFIKMWIVALKDNRIGNNLRSCRRRNILDQ